MMITCCICFNPVKNVYSQCATLDFFLFLWLFHAWNALISKIPDLVRFDQTHFISTCLVHLHFCHALALSRCARYPLAPRGNTRNFPNEHRGPLASMTNARRPYVKLHVCLILNQTHKEKGLGLVKTSGSLGTPGFAPSAPLWLWKKVSMLHVFQSLPTFTASCFFIVEILVDTQGCLQNCQHIPSPSTPTFLLFGLMVQLFSECL